jgi:copper transport protein
MITRYRSGVLAVCLFVVGLILTGTTPPLASAHAFLQRALPVNGTVVASNIGAVRLTFNERVEVRPERVTVTGSDGQRYDLRDAHAAPGDPLTVVVSLPQLPNGVYTVRYALISSDTHPITGTLRFGVGVTPAEVLEGGTATQETGLTGPVLLQSLGRWINLLGLVLLIGPIAFRFFVLVPFRRRVAPEDEGPAARLFEARTVRWTWIAVTVLILGLVISLIAASISSTLGTVGEALQPQALAATLNGRFGTLWLARLALLLVPALALPVIAADYELGNDEEAEEGAPTGRGRGGWWAILGGGVALALLTSIGGHPAATEPVVLTVAVDWLHLLATAAWIGGLVALGLILPGVVRSLGAAEGATTLAATAARFSTLALVAIQVLAVTGFYQTWAHIPGPENLLGSTYGRALAAKLLLLVPLLALGAISHFVIVPRLRALAAGATAQPEGGQPGGQPITRRLWRTIWGEAAVAVVLLAVVGVLTALPPARSTAAEELAGDGDSAALPSGVTLAGSAGPLLVNLTIGPTGSGPAVVAATLRDPQGATVENAAVRLRATPPGGAAPVEVALDATGGRYTGLVDLARPGAWTLEALVTPPGGAPATATFALQLPTGGAMSLLAGADAAMNRLTSLRERQVLSSGDTAITTEYEWSAPDRMRLRSDTGNETTVVGTRRFDRANGGQWIESPWPEAEGYRWPQSILANTAAEVTLLGRETIEGVDCWVITFLDTTADARITLWIGVDDSLIRQQRMFAIGHYMQSRFYDFNVPIEINAP